MTVSPGCVRAILSGHKTMLRSVAADSEAACPFGGRGAKLWVREPWKRSEDGRYLFASDAVEPSPGEWRPGRDMPRDAARILIEVAGTRLERLQDIPDGDLEREGGLWRTFPNASSPRAAFGCWWDSLHPRAGTLWADNPWVWVVSFRRVEQATPRRA